MTRTLLGHVVGVLMATLWVCLSPLTAGAPLQWVAQDDESITLEYRKPAFTRVKSQSNPQGCVDIEVPGWITYHQFGQPALPFTATLLQVPRDAVVSAEVLASDFAVISDTVLCPVADADGESFFLPPPSEDFFPSQWIEWSEVSILRGVPLIQVRVAPFQWQAQTKQLRVLNSLRVRLQFGASRRAGFSPSQGTVLESAHQSYETILQQTVLNYRATESSQSVQSAADSRARRQGISESDSNRKPPESRLLKIEVNQPGLYELSYQALAAAGVPVDSLSPQRLELWNRHGQPVAIQVVTKQPDKFQTGDYLTFYAEALESMITDTNVYWLQWRARVAGKRMVSVDGSVSGQGQPLGAFYDTRHFENNKELWEGTPGAPEQDYWFWERFNAPLEAGKGQYPLSIPFPVRDEANGVLRVNFRGRSTAPPHPNHHTILQLNDTVISDEFWDNDVDYIQTASFSPRQLKEPDNLLKILVPGDTGAKVDTIYLNWIEVYYWRQLKAIDDKLTFTLSGNGRHTIAVESLSQPTVLIYDITDPQAVLAIEHFTIQPTGNQNTVLFETDLQGSKTFFVTTRQALKKPIALTLWQSPALKSPKNGADYLLITAKAFLSAVQPLAELRRQQGLRVKTVSVEDLYNEFNHGVFDPAALKAFLKYAYENWARPAPTYVLLVGDATIDYHHYLGTKKKQNIVPVHLSPGSDTTLTPNDNWYVSVDGHDALPDMFIGRIPGGTEKQITALINKIIRFETTNTPAPHSILLVSDREETFEKVNDSVLDYLPGGFNIDKVYLRLYHQQATTADETKAQTDRARQDLIAALNRGQLITSYIGHGLANNWSAATGLFHSGHIEQLTNQDALSFVLTLSCINGYFALSSGYSLAEALISADNKGAIGVFSPSGLSYLSQDVLLLDEIFSAFFEKNQTRIGALTTAAKLAAYQRGMTADMLDAFTLFGDPATALKAWTP